MGEECCGHLGLQVAEPTAGTDTVTLGLEQERFVAGRREQILRRPLLRALWAFSGQRGATEQMEEGGARHDLHVRKCILAE